MCFFNINCMIKFLMQDACQAESSATCIAYKVKVQCRCQRGRGIVQKWFIFCRWQHVLISNVGCYYNIYKYHITFYPIFRSCFVICRHYLAACLLSNRENTVEDKQLFMVRGRGRPSNSEKQWNFILYPRKLKIKIYLKNWFYF